MEGKHIQVRAALPLDAAVDAQCFRTATSLVAVLGSGMIDQDASDGSRGHRHEVLPVLPDRLCQPCQSDVRLMNNRRRLKGVVGPFPPHLTLCNGAECLVEFDRGIVCRGRLGLIWHRHRGQPKAWLRRLSNQHT
jgi:hypothetical protein